MSNTAKLDAKTLARIAPLNTLNAPLTDTVVELLTIPLSAARARYVEACDSYYGPSNRAIMPDSAYDVLEARLCVQDPTFMAAYKVAHAGNVKLDAVLPVPAPSLDKFYPHELDKLLRWLAQYAAPHSVLISSKLDGCSVLVQYVNGKPVKAFTRGKGSNGKTLHGFLKHFPNGVLPARMKGLYANCVVRCEALVSEENYSAHYTKEFATARAMVNGILNRNNKVHPAISSGHVRLVALRVFLTNANGDIDATKSELRQSTMLEDLEGMGWETVMCRSYSQAAMREKATTRHGGNMAAWLSAVLESWRAHSIYEMDGLVLRVNAPNCVMPLTGDLDRYAVAFKENNVGLETTAKQVVWQLGRSGVFTPVIMTEPVIINGTKVTRATAYNASWMEKEGLGVGARIQLVKSGEVIPKVVEVLKRAPFTGPSEEECNGARVGWDANRTHLRVLENSEATKSARDVLNYVNVLRILGMKHLAEANLTSLASVPAGSTAGTVARTPLWWADLLTSKAGAVDRIVAVMNGVSRKTVERALTTAPKRVTLAQALALSATIPGVDVKTAQRFWAALEAYVDGAYYLETGTTQEKDAALAYGLVRTLRLGFLIADEAKRKAFLLEVCEPLGPKTAEKFATHLPAFYEDLEACSNTFVSGLVYRESAYVAKKEVALKANADLKGQIVTCTSFTPTPQQEEAILARGATLADWSAKTTILVYGDRAKSHAKIAKAEQRGIRVTPYSEL